MNLIQEFQIWMEKTPELYPPDNEDLTAPDFSSFYRKNHHALFMRVLIRAAEYLRIKKRNIFSMRNFIRLVREQIGVHQAQTSDEIVRSLDHNSRFIVFGDIRGAAHSIIRDLKHLVEMGIMDENLKIKSVNDCVVINGNFVGRSPVNIETMIVILYVMIRNPQQFVCLKGPHEHCGEWRNFDLKNALIHRCYHLDSGMPPCGDILDLFFSLLPSRLILKGKPRTIEISPFRTVFGARDRPIDGRISSRDRTYEYSVSMGVEALFAEDGVIEWAQFSSPTFVNNQLYQFYYDAFTVLDCAQWAYTLYYRDIRRKEDYKATTVNFFTREKFSTDHSAGKTPVVIGVSLDLSETASILGKRLRAGIYLGAHYYNRHLQEKLISPVFLNDKYTPFISVKNVERFLSKHATDIVFSPLGTPTTQALLPLVQEKKIFVMFPYSGANIFRTADLDYIVHIRASYEAEAEELIRYADEVLQLKRFAFFYQNDSYGIEPLKAAIKRISGRKDISYVESSYMRNTPNVHLPAKKIIDFSPEAIFFFSTYAPSTALIHEIGVDRLAGKFLLGISFLTDIFRSFCRSKGLDFIISRVTPKEHEGTNQLMQDFQSSLGKSHSANEYSVDTLEGFIATALFGYIIDKINGDVTKEKIYEIVTGIRKINFKGLDLNYNSQTKELFSDVWVDDQRSVFTW